MKKLLYIANYRLPTEKAHGVQIMFMCDAFAKLGLEVELVLPNRNNSIKEDIFSYYGLDKTFKVSKLSVVDLVGKIPRLGFLIESYTFARSVLKFVKEQSQDVVLYSRDLITLYYLAKKNIPYYYELHTFPKEIKKIHQLVYSKANKIFVLNNNLKKKVVASGIAENKVVIVQDGVDLKRFSDLPSKEEACQKLNLDASKKNLVYVGHLYDHKGAPTLLEASKYLDDDFQFLIVGGTPDKVAEFKDKYTDQKIKLVGQVKNFEVPMYLAAADFLILPNSGKSMHSREETSPMKLFEYMASNRPIIASEVESLREVLDEKTCFFFTPDDPKSLAETIKIALASNHSQVAQQARTEVNKYSWEERAKIIISQL